MAELHAQQVPAHVPPDRVFEFDLYGLTDDPRLRDGVQTGLTFLHREAPDVFFTPANSGHWVVTRERLMREVLMSPERFSSAQLTVPRTAQQQPLIPLTLDPPEHTPYRKVLMQFFAPKVVAAMEGDIRRRAAVLVAAVREAGECDFLQQVAMPLPVQVFMDLMGLPSTMFSEFRRIVVDWFGSPNGPRRQALAVEVLGHLRSLIADRRTAPRDDLVSALMVQSVEGRVLRQDEIESMCFLLFLAGLDTVANAAGFMFARLATMPDMQERLANEPDLVSRFIDETLRMSGVVSTARIVTQDTELGGAHLKQGDMILCPLALAGLDETANADPLHFKLDRKGATHLMFATGPHLCVGHFLARLELRALLAEWLRAVPHFRLDPSLRPQVKIGSMTAMLSLALKWGGEERVLAEHG
ncbi:cytochrome P450 [Sphingomonas sp.]|uniref:cytochrome P450 n=1 Tax=Sphingomonas sp. TaxID=28214 RepID=UPI003CC64018